MLQLEWPDCFSLSQEEKTMVFIIFCLLGLNFDFGVDFRFLLLCLEAAPQCYKGERKSWHTLKSCEKLTNQGAVNLRPVLLCFNSQKRNLFAPKRGFTSSSSEVAFLPNSASSSLPPPSPNSPADVVLYWDLTVGCCHRSDVKPKQHRCTSSHLYPAHKIVSSVELSWRGGCFPKQILSNLSRRRNSWRRRRG